VRLLAGERPVAVLRFYSVICGFSIGVSYLIWRTSIVRWFADRQGFASAWPPWALGSAPRCWGPS
jgi:hypothetical protein